jgi:hypothetical protein
MNILSDNRIKQMMSDFGMPDSTSLMLLINQVQNEVLQTNRPQAPAPVAEPVAEPVAIDKSCASCAFFSPMYGSCRAVVKISPLADCVEKNMAHWQPKVAEPADEICECGHSKVDHACTRGASLWYGCSRCTCRKFTPRKEVPNLNTVINQATQAEINADLFDIVTAQEFKVEKLEGR